MKESRYEVFLTLREYHDPCQTTTISTAEVCMASFLRRLKQESDVLLKYDSIILDQLIKGIVEVITDHEGA